MMEKFKFKFEDKSYDAVSISWHDQNDKIGERVMLFASDLLYDDLFEDRESDKFVNADAERLFDLIEYFTDDAHNATTEADFINKLCDENPDYYEVFNKHVVRRCSICGKVMDKGYMDNFSDWHACSDECRDNYYAGHGGIEAMKADVENDACFYTEWDSIYYDI